MATLISGKVNFRARNYQGHRGIFHQENIRILSGYAPDNRVSQHLKQKPMKLKRKIDKSTIIIQDFKVPF